MKNLNNKIQLSDPFHSIHGDKEKKLLKKDLQFMEEKDMANRFIRRRVAFFMDGYRYAGKAMTKRWGINVSFFESGHDQIKKAYISKNLEPEAANLWWNMMDKDKNFSIKLVKELLYIIKWGKKLAKKVPQKVLTNSEIEKYLYMHLDWWISFFELAYLWFCIEDIKKRIDLKITETWKSFDYKGISVTPEYFIEHVYRPMKFPTSSLEQRALLGIAKLKRNRRENALRMHIEKFHHLSLHNIDDAYFNEDYYKSRLNALDSSVEYENLKKNLSIADQELNYADGLLKAAQVSDWLKKRIEFVRWFMYLRTESVDTFMLVNSSYKVIFQSLSKIFNLSMDEVLHMTYQEIFTGLKNNNLLLLRQTILDRARTGYAYLIAPNTDFLVVGKEVDELAGLIIKKQDQAEITELRGQVAYKGRAQGRARIIIDRRFANDLKEGEILITTMTSPEFVPSMRRAGAIVTNEGGILCHAAIMSREFQKPCVIGTKIATEIFHNGDFVEVDADRGIVKILGNNVRASMRF